MFILEGQKKKDWKSRNLWSPLRLLRGTGYLTRYCLSYKQHANNIYPSFFRFSTSKVVYTYHLRFKSRNQTLFYEDWSRSFSFFELRWMDLLWLFLGVDSFGDGSSWGAVCSLELTLSTESVALCDYWCSIRYWKEDWKEERKEERKEEERKEILQKMMDLSWRNWKDWWKTMQAYNLY